MVQRVLTTSILSMLLWPGCSSGEPPTRAEVPVVSSSAGSSRRTLVHDGLERDYLLVVPGGYRSDQPAPVVVMFHGSGQSAKKFHEKRREMNRVCERQGVILVYPNGTAREDGYGWSSSPDHPEATVDDLAFVGVLMATLQKELAIDADRVFAAGFSNGGKMVHLLLSQAPDVFAAGAVVASAIGVGQTGQTLMTPTPRAPRSMMIINGRRDGKRPWDGGANTDGVYNTSVREAVTFWSTANACPAQPETQNLERNAGKIHRFEHCSQGTEVVFVGLTKMDHSWPDAAEDFGFDANTEIIEFFTRH